MLGLMGFSGSLPLYVIHRYYIFVFIDRANKDACLSSPQRTRLPNINETLRAPFISSLTRRCSLMRDGTRHMRHVFGDLLSD